MLNNNAKILEYLDKEIKDLEEALKRVKQTNKLLKISIRKKELLLQKLGLNNRHNS